MRLFKSKHLGDKIFGYTMLFYLVVVCAITIWLVTENYRSARQGILRELNIYESTFSQPLAENVRSKDMDRLSTLMQGIVQIPQIAGVRIIDPNTGQILARRGWVPHPRDGIQRYYRQDGTVADDQGGKKVSDSFDYRFRLVYQMAEKKEVVGEVTLFSDTSVIFDRVKYRIVLTVAGAIVQLVLLWIFFSWISKRFLSRPLLRLKDTVESFDLNRPEAPPEALRIEGEDELAILSRAFAKMQKRLVETLRSLNQNQLELRHLNENLEAKVDERTVELQEKQKQLEAAVERSRLLLDSAGEGIFGVDLEGKVVFINPAANRMLGYGPDDLIGQYVHEKIHHSHEDGTPYPKKECPMFLTYSTGTDHYISNEVLWRADGTPFNVEYTSMPIKKDGRAVGAVVTFMDITERKKIETALLAEREQLQKILDNSPAGVGISTDNIVRFANPRFTELFDRQIGQTAQEAYVNPEDRNDMLAELEKSGIVRDVELQTYGPGGKICDTLATFIRTEYEGRTGVLAWMVDLSGPKKAERELKTRLDELARFRRMAIGREQKMIELKKEINELLKESGNGEKYKIH
ncbi:MAG: PAS domain S-box protein [Desulfobacterales bacterium]|jgi:PAS domain S-box-containing protein